MCRARFRIISTGTLTPHDYWRSARGCFRLTPMSTLKTGRLENHFYSLNVFKCDSGLIQPEANSVSSLARMIEHFGTERSDGFARQLLFRAMLPATPPPKNAHDACGDCSCRLSPVLAANLDRSRGPSSTTTARIRGIAPASKTARTKLHTPERV